MLMTFKSGQTTSNHHDPQFRDYFTRVEDRREHWINGGDIIQEFTRDCFEKVSIATQTADFKPLLPVEEQANLISSLPLGFPLALMDAAHLYYAIEHALLDTGSVDGVINRHVDFGNRRDLDTNNTLMRLDAFNTLGESVCWSLRRDYYSPEAADELCEQFNERYGQYIVSFFQQFSPMKFHYASLSRLRNQRDQDGQISALDLSAGNRSDKKTVDFVSMSDSGAPRASTEPQPKSLPYNPAGHEFGILDANRLLSWNGERARVFCGRVGGRRCLQIDGTPLPSVVKIINALYRDVFSTSAFQTAVCCSFFREIENTEGLPARTYLNRRVVFDEYIQQLNEFFAPETGPQLMRLLEVFGELRWDETTTEWIHAKDANSLRFVSSVSDVHPDQWPIYRAILLELWHPSVGVLMDRVKIERDVCRSQIFGSLYNHSKVKRCQENGILQSQLTEIQEKSVFKTSTERFFGFLKNLGADDLPSIDALRQIADDVSHV